MKKAGRGARGCAAPGERLAERSSGGGIGRGARLVGLAAVLVLSAAAVAPLVPRGVNPYDEGLLAYGAERVLHGHHPGVHFYSPYGPGVFYVVAAAYRLFGTRLLVERWVAGLLLIMVGGLAYALLMERWSGGGAGGAPPSGDQRDHRRADRSDAAWRVVVSPY